METIRLYGATPKEWESAEHSPLMPWIVPIVSNPNVPSSAASKAMRNKYCLHLFFCLTIIVQIIKHNATYKQFCLTRLYRFESFS